MLHAVSQGLHSTANSLADLDLTPSGNNYYIQLNKWQICMPQIQEITKWKTKSNI